MVVGSSGVVVVGEELSACIAAGRVCSFKTLSAIIVPQNKQKET